MSHMRSRTLSHFAYHPCVAGKSILMFKKEDIEQWGPAWSYLSLTQSHGRYYPVVGWERTTGPLREGARAQGNSVVHDFSLGQYTNTWVLFSWSGIWQEKALRIMTKKQNAKAKNQVEELEMEDLDGADELSAAVIEGDADPETNADADPGVAPDAEMEE